MHGAYQNPPSAKLTRLSRLNSVSDSQLLYAEIIQRVEKLPS